LKGGIFRSGRIGRHRYLAVLFILAPFVALPERIELEDMAPGHCGECPEVRSNSMETTTIPGIDLRVSRIGLGTWAIGGWMWGGADDRESIRTIHAALDKGINLLDSAPVYGFGRSEEIVGQAITQLGCRDRVIIATKVGLQWSKGLVLRNASRARILKEVDDSLRRLQTSYIDVYQVHWPDPRIPVEETAEAMNQLYREGKIRAIGVSNYSPADMERFRSVAPLHLDQPPYNLFERQSEGDVLLYLRENSIITLTYGSLCRGLLSGRMSADTVFQGDDLRKTDPKFRPPIYAQYLRAVKRLDQFAQEHYGKRVLDLAVRWVLDQPGVTATLWGARRPAQISAVDGIEGWKLDASALRAIDGILRETILNPVGAGSAVPLSWPAKQKKDAQEVASMSLSAAVTAN
jgi:aryl-alcohol dehydrogenase-like predicted oxidoreductase